MAKQISYINEGTTEILFPSDSQFTAFRDLISVRYSPAMVKVERCKVYTDGRGTLAEVHHARGLGAEIKGLAYSDFGGKSIRTVFAKPPTLDPPTRGDDHDE